MSEINIDRLNIQVSADTATASTGLDKLITTLERLETATNRFNTASSQTSSTSQALNRISNAGNKASKSFLGLSGGVTSLVGKFFTFTAVARFVKNGLADAYEESNNYIEILNKFSVAMGSATESAKDYAETVQEAMGIDAGEWMDYQGTFNTLLRGFGTASDTAQIMSQNLTQLAYDYSSLFNEDVADSAAKLQSAMSGQVKGLKSYGNDVSVAAVKQNALKYGIDQTFSSLDRSTQAWLRYQTIMENASKTGVFNDMARTIVTPANALRILNSQITQMKRALGDVVSVFAAKVIPVFQVFVQLVTKAAKALANLFGFKLPSIDYSGMDYGVDGSEEMDENLGSASNKAKEIKKQLMGFDELNILKAPDDSSSKSGSAGSIDLSKYDLLQYDFLEGLENRTNEVLGNLFKPLKESWAIYGEGITERVSNTFSSIGSVVEGLKQTIADNWGSLGFAISSAYLAFMDTALAIAEFVGNAFKSAWDNGGEYLVQSVIEFTESVAGFLTKTFEAVKPYADWFAQEVGPFIGEVVGDIATLIGWIFDLGERVIEFMTTNETAWGIISGTYSLIAGTLQTLIEVVMDVYEGIKNAVLWVIDIIVNFEERFEEFKVFIGKKIDDIVAYFKALPGKILSAISDAILFVGDWGAKLAQKGAIAAADLAKAVVNGIVSLPSRLYSIGADLVRGLWNGITSLGGWISSQISSFGSSLVNGFKNVFGIHSPSKVMEEEIGNYLGEGIIVGLETKLTAPKKSVSDLIAETRGTIDTQISSDYTINSGYSLSDDLTAGLYRALMAANESGGRDSNINVTIEMDGEKVARKTFKYHNNVVKQTGVSPLII